MPDAHPTVFLAVHQGFSARYLLRTDILPTLRAAACRIVILTPNHDEPYMVEEFAGEDVVLEPFAADSAMAKREHERRRSRILLTRASRFLMVLRKYSLGNPEGAPAHQEKYERFLERSAAKQPLRAWLLRRATRRLSRSARLRRLALAADTRLSPPPHEATLFDRYRPDLVVTASPGFYPGDMLLLREARRRGVRTVACVLGWDNPTSKGYRGADPDHIVVWSERMAQQMVEHHDYPRERIFVAGVPHFDRYVRDGALPEREELFARLGLDPERRLILYTASTPGSFRHNVLVAETLARAITEDTLGTPAQLVVRLHPVYLRGNHSEPLEDYDRVAEQYEHVHLDMPEVVSSRLRVDMPISDSERVNALVKHCDVVVNVFSTTTLEACLADRPAVMIASDAHLSDEEKARTKSRAFHTYAHMRRVMESGAGRMAGSMDELLELTRAYLADPARDRQARLEVAREELGPSDGHAGERIGRFLLEAMGRAPATTDESGATAAAAATR